MSKKVLISGITGFLGSQLAEELVHSGYKVYGIKRINSNTERCKTFEDKVIWVNIEDDSWKQKIYSLKPNIFLHSAWEGVGASDRNNWQLQLNNIDITYSLLEIAKEVKAEKFIGFGSQAEYGFFSGKIDEKFPVNPNSGYGLSKNLVSQLIKFYCEQNNLNWYWLRLFSFFGEKEANNWFIPTVIKNIFENTPMDMTPGKQKYAYMYVNDLAIIVKRIIESNIKSDIYNLSSNNVMELKIIVEKIIKIVNPNNPQINFGALPYRENQPMLIQGDTSKLSEELGGLFETDFDINLQKVVEYNINKLKN